MGVLFVAVAIGVMMTVFYGILRPRTFDRSLDRLVLAILFALAISFLFSPLKSGMSGAYYVVGWFSVSSAFLLLLFALPVAVRAAMRNGRWHSVFGVAWLLAVVGATLWALAPPYSYGFVGPYEPWTGILFVAVAVGVMMTVFYWILRPRTFDRSWRRLAAAIPFALVMSLLFYPFQWHISGSFYFVGWLSVLSAYLLLLSSVVLACTSLRDRWGRRQVRSPR